MVCIFTGRPAYEMYENDPDWIPTKDMGNDTKCSDTDRHSRAKARSDKKEAVSALLSLGGACRTEMDESTECDLMDDQVVSQDMHTMSISTQTELTSFDITNMETELNNLYEEKRCLQERVNYTMPFSKESFENDDDKTKFYTGLPSFATLLALLNFLGHLLPQKSRLSPFQTLMIVFLKLRLNLPTQHIAYLFNMHRTTISCTFKDAISVMYTQMKPLVKWPERQFLQRSMPHQFIEAFGNKVAVIIDCFEIFIERPSNLKARSETFSHYKHNNTLKYLIGVTPRGEISFISKGWGGRTSDKHITEESGFLNNLLPNDIILADRGFDISDSVGMMYAEVKIPAFTRGKSQLCAKDVESTRKIAHLRIHVERVIGNLVNKYNIISDTLPIELILPCFEENVAFLDKIVFVCCALTNMCPSVVLS